MNKGPESIFFEENIKTGQQVSEKVLKSTNQGNVNQNHNELSPHICFKITTSKMLKDKQVLARMWRKENTHSAVVM
jgi:hypothetical protein